MPEFYNEADHIDYPFTKGFDRTHSGGTFDGKGFLDLKIITGPDTNFFEHENTVTWTGFSVGPADVIFLFLVENVGTMTFIVPLNSPYGFATSTEIILSGLVVATGTLVTSDLSYFSALPQAPYTMVTPPVVIPTLVTALRGAFVTEVQTANDPRRRPLGCCEEDTYGPFPPPPSVPESFGVGTYPVVGDAILLKEGFNCYINLIESSNTIVIGSKVGAGEGEDDGTDSFLIDNWAFQSLTPYKCNDFISSVNGVQSADDNILRLLSRGGLAFTSDVLNNKIIATLSNQGPTCA